MFVGAGDQKPAIDTSVSGCGDSSSSSRSSSSSAENGSTDERCLGGSGGGCDSSTTIRRKNGHSFRRSWTVPHVVNKVMSNVGVKEQHHHGVDTGASKGGEPGLDMVTDSHLETCRSSSQRSLSYSGVAEATARRRHPLFVHHSAHTYADEEDFAVLSDYSSAGTDSSGVSSSDFFLGQEDPCLEHIPRLGEWRSRQNSSKAREQGEAGVLGPGQVGGRGEGGEEASGEAPTAELTSTLLLRVDLEEHGEHAGRPGAGETAFPFGVPIGGCPLLGEHRRANARARARAFARARASSRAQGSPTGAAQPLPIRQRQLKATASHDYSPASLGSDTSAIPARPIPPAEFVYETPRDQQQQQRQRRPHYRTAVAPRAEKTKSPRAENASLESNSCATCEGRAPPSGNRSPPGFRGAFGGDDAGVDGAENGSTSSDEIPVSQDRVGERGPAFEGGVVNVPTTAAGAEGFELEFLAGRTVGSRSLTSDTGGTASTSSRSSSSGGGGLAGGGIEHVRFQRGSESARLRRSSTSGPHGIRMPYYIPCEDRTSDGHSRGHGQGQGRNDATERKMDRSDSFSLSTHTTACTAASSANGRSQSLRDGTASGERRRSKNDYDRPRIGSGSVFDTVRKGIRMVWDRVTHDHPEPLPVDRVRVVCKEEETVWR